MARGDAVSRVLARYKGRKAQSGKGWLLFCPAHDDKSEPSLHLSQGYRGAILKCFAGCETAAVVAALGLEEHALFDDDGERASPSPGGGRPRSRQAVDPEEDRVSVARLAKRFALPEDHLRALGLRQVQRSVAIPYRAEDGSELFARRRVRMTGGRKILQPAGTRPVPYGLERLPALRDQPDGRRGLILVEGESDCWCLWLHGFPALGIPGASLVRCLEAGHLAGVEELFVVQEPGAGGENFVAGLATHLREELGFRGPVRVVAVPDHKDPAELHASDPDAFKAAFREACRHAAPIESAIGLDDLVVRLDQVERRTVTFLWAPRIPIGKLTILAGKPGQGKSFVTHAIVCSLTSGSPLPGEAERREPCDVLLFAAEDDASDTLRPRLEDNGADLRRVHLFDLSRRAFSFGDAHFTTLEMLIQRIRPKLVIFDPIVSFMGTRVDINRQNEVRSVLQPLIEIAKRHQVAILVVAHATKGSPSAAIDQIMGSVDFSAAVRSAMIAYPDPKKLPHEEGGVLTHAKTNVSRRGESLRYVIDGTRFFWRGTTQLSADDLASMSAGSGVERGALEEARRYLESELGDGPRRARELQAGARSQGISPTTLARARFALGVLTRREGFQGPFEWYLPGVEERTRLDAERGRKWTGSELESDDAPV